MRMSAKTVMCGLGSIAILATSSGAFAQMPMKSGDSMKGDSMKGGAMAHGDMKMSKHQMKMMKKCMAMSPAKMKANAKCEAMADKNPDMMKSDGMKSDGMMKK